MRAARAVVARRDCFLFLARRYGLCIAVLLSRFPTRKECTTLHVQRCQLSKGRKQFLVRWCLLASRGWHPADWRCWEQEVATAETDEKKRKLRSAINNVSNQFCCFGFGAETPARERVLGSFRTSRDLGGDGRWLARA